MIGPLNTEQKSILNQMLINSDEHGVCHTAIDRLANECELTLTETFGSLEALKNAGAVEFMKVDSGVAFKINEVAA